MYMCVRECMCASLLQSSSVFPLLVNELQLVTALLLLNYFSLKVHPSSLSIEGTLGNFRLCDMSIGTEHCWGWLCDIRNPGVESLIKVDIVLFNELLLSVDISLYHILMITSPF